MRLTALAVSALVLVLAQPASAAPLDDVGEAIAKLQLEIGTHEAGYIDAYYGPPEWKTEAEARKRTKAVLAAEAAALKAQVDAVPTAGLSPIEVKRKAFLSAQMTAAVTRLGMMEGKKPAFRDEAEALLGWRPDLKPLSHYDPILARLEAIVPGEGDLAERVDAFKQRYVVPKDRLDAVMRAGIAECRKRTAAHIDLPAEESFKLEFVTDKSWSGYNWYQGGYNSVIQINTDLPIFVDRAVDLGCHEGYPGHHVQNMAVERQLVRGQGWKEMALYPLYSPTSFLAEGTGNYGIELAFPGDDELVFERDVLFPLAGLDPATAKAYYDLREAMKGLANARITIAADYLDGKLDKETATRLIQMYQLVSRARAEQSMRFIEEYRTYVMNYGTGLDVVREYVEAQGATPDARWKAFERILNEPTLPRDLAVE